MARQGLFNRSTLTRFGTVSMGRARHGEVRIFRSHEAGLGQSWQGPIWSGGVCFGVAGLGVDI